MTGSGEDPRARCLIGDPDTPTIGLPDGWWNGEAEPATGPAWSGSLPAAIRRSRSARAESEQSVMIEQEMIGDTDTAQIPAKEQTASAPRNKNAFRYLAGHALIALGIGTVVCHFIEEWTWVDSFSFSSAATLTTVEFGDLTSTSDLSKIFTVVYPFGGVSLIGATLKAFLQRLSEKVSDRCSGDRATRSRGLISRSHSFRFLRRG